jgi:hypothetical protein
VAAPIEIVPVGDLVESLPGLAQEGIDLILASQATVEALGEAHRSALHTAGAVTL